MAPDDPYVDVTALGAVADGTTDCRHAVEAAVAAIAAGGPRVLYFPPGRYKLKQYVEIAGLADVLVWGNGATIIYPSGDATIPKGTTPSESTARSAFLLRHCSAVRFEGLTFFGDSQTDITIQLGSGVYATHCVDITLLDCNMINGASLVQQDALPATAHTPEKSHQIIPSLRVSSSQTPSGQVVTLMTLVDPTRGFVRGHGVGCRYITIHNATIPVNNGVFRVVSYMSPTTLVYENPNGVTEDPSSYRWSIDDNDRGLTVRGGRSYGTRKPIFPTNNTLITGHTFELPDTADICGIGDALSRSPGTDTVTLTDYSDKISPRLVGKYITIAGAVAANNGLFLITAAMASAPNDPGTIEFTNDSGVDEPLFTGTWWIANGEKTGVGGVSGAFTIEGGPVTVDPSTDTFTRTNHRYLTGTNIRFTGIDPLPDGLSGGDYYVIASKDDPDTFQIATSASDAGREAPRSVPIGSAGGPTLSVSAGVTLTVTTPSFSASDISKNIRILGPMPVLQLIPAPPRLKPNPNLGTFTIGLASATAVTYANWKAIAEDLPVGSGQWTIDGYDRVGGSNDGNGSSHAIYAFADRHDVKVIGCSFLNVRTVAVKVSGSSGPISDVLVANCHFRNCGAAAVWGADDSCEHSSLSFVDNVLVDCTTNRPGWSEGATVGILGSRGVQIRGNTFHYTQNNIGPLAGTGLGADNAISASRYQAGRSQPVEGVIVDGNVFTCDPQQTSPTQLLHAAISATRVGQLGYWNTNGTLTKALPTPTDPNPETMTLHDPKAFFTAQLVGRPITLVNSAKDDDGTMSANDGTFTVKSVPSTSTLTYTKPAGPTIPTGPGSPVSAGTYRINPARSLGDGRNSNHRGGTLQITNNTFNNVCDTVISTSGCVSPEITGNTWAFGAVKSTGDVAPVIRRNKSTASSTGSAQIQLASPVWPVVGDNLSVNVNHFGTSIAARDMTIGVGAAVTDYPLLGTRGRAKPTNAHEEIVIAYGSDHVDGDTLVVGTVTYTYKASTPSGNQFNSLLRAKPSQELPDPPPGLIDLIHEQTGYDCTDYGAQFTPAVASGKLHIRRQAQSGTDGNALVRSSTLNPTALVILRNEHTSPPGCKSRGSGSANPVPDKPVIPDKTVIWSPLAGHTAVAGLAAANPPGRAILRGSYLQLRNVSDSGACAMVQTDRTDDGTLTDLGGEFRWWLVS